MKRLILELSLKPFRDLSDESIRAVCAGVLRQWQALVSESQSVAFLIWAADGSEILDYRGELNDEFEWAKWIGDANKPNADKNDLTAHLHSHRWLYCENPPRFTYERLSFVVRALKDAAREYSGKPCTVGATFDPGPEFAESSFKYSRHREISIGDTMGKGKWVHCAAVLRGDETAYAGFPDGIPEGTTLGTFLGRQSRHFLRDLGFDYLWLSNGFGYSLSSWNVTGEVFDGTRFDTASAPQVRERILRFWKDFRRECPDFPLETRGSNLSTGMDLSSDASPLRDIYRGGFDLVAPPNSPWAAINGDYGLELVGWLSHIAELPADSGVPFRFYSHDPWWLNSPWLDRYGREAHDIYLPLAVSRLDEKGEVEKPDSIAFLTIDDSYGHMPDEVPLEITPHIRRALADFPDEPGLVTWIYPFYEYHEWTFGTPSRVSEVFFGDWFMRSAVNQGFPLSNAISSANFVTAQKRKTTFADTILVAPVPDASTPLADALLQHIENGGQLLLYGPIRNADARLLELLNLEAGAAISGELKFCTMFTPDEVSGETFPDKLFFRDLLSGGGAEAVSTHAENNTVVANVCNEDEDRVFAAFKVLPNGGQLGWVRGAFCANVTQDAPLPISDDPSEYFTAERTMRWMLEKFGYKIRFDKPSLSTPDPLILAARCRNAWFFSGFTPSTNTRLRWKFPQGVPVPVGCDVKIEDGNGTMSLQRAWHRECRVFVEQEYCGEVSCREQHSGEVGIARRLMLRGLKNAAVVFLAEPHSSPRFQKHDAYLGRGTKIPALEIEPGVWKIQSVSGDFLISW